MKSLIFIYLMVKFDYSSIQSLFDEKIKVNNFCHGFKRKEYKENKNNER